MSDALLVELLKGAGAGGLAIYALWRLDTHLQRVERVAGEIRDKLATLLAR